MSILHQDYHIPLIRSGEKTQTRRIWKPNYNRPVPGRVHAISLDMLAPITECDCFVRIQDVYREPLGAMTDEDAQQEGDYDSVAAFREAWLEINGPETWSPSDPGAIPGMDWTPEVAEDGTIVVDVVDYEYVGRAKTCA